MDRDVTGMSAAQLQARAAGLAEAARTAALLVRAATDRKGEWNDGYRFGGELMAASLQTEARWAYDLARRRADVERKWAIRLSTAA